MKRLSGLAREAYLKLAKGEIVSPERAWLTTGKGLSIYCMASYRAGAKTVSVKIARLSLGNLNHSLPSVKATIHVYDSRT